ncbi:MAG: serine protease [Flavobacteriaceae bacterium TMED238]|nr:MAG: serine protease [Flavobacteriaceae bacterium TMED238]
MLVSFDDDFLDDDFLDDELDNEFEDLYETHSFFDEIIEFFRELDKKIVIGVGVLTLSIISIPIIQNFNSNNLTVEEKTITGVEDAELDENSQGNKDGGSNQYGVENTTTTTVTTNTSPTTTVKTNESLTTDPLQSTVMVALPDCEYMGSGTIVSKLGYILTNEHVVSDDGSFCNDFIVILTSESGEKDPVPKYIAEIVEQSVALDIAILEIIGTYDGSPMPKFFKNMCVGDSNSVAQGDNLLVWGYPDVRWVNFDTPGRIDVSQGFVSGFDAETGLSEKAWISLSSTISSGNSGGGAYNELGQLVGVPTAVFQGNLSSRGLLRPMNLVLEYFDSFYFESCK